MMTNSNNKDTIIVDRIKLDNNPDLFFNRELSLIEFQRRVLSEALKPEQPLLERLKFCAIVSSNLDEFFMIRVAGLKSQVAGDMIELSYDGMPPTNQLLEIRRRLLPIYKQQEEILINNIFPELEKNGINFYKYEQLDSINQAKVKDIFYKRIMPILTPISLGPTNPFPRLINRSLNIAFLLIDKRSKIESRHVAFVQLPAVLQRFIKLDMGNTGDYILVEHIIKAFSNDLFPGFEIQVASTFRVTRDADIEIAEDEADDLLSELAEQIKQRNWERAAVRLEVSSRMPDYLVNLLMNALELEPNDVYIHNRPLNLIDFMQLYKLDLWSIKDTPFQSFIPAEFKDDKNIFEEISKSDILLHHPFDSFTNTTLKLINEAACDDKVVAIKITLYRTGLNSGIVEALKKAAENGKIITAFVELKARFDEEKNIIWAKALERVGAHVVYGVPGLKTHCKIAMIVRQEGDELKTYLHLSTGNYNQITARLYTDVSLFTSNTDFANDATYLFNYLTAYSYHQGWKQFILAPINLKDNIINLINREIELHTPDNPGLIIAKMNALAHRDVIPALYRASQKGVKIKLLVRGICCLKPGIKDVSDNIEVRSIIGRFLEHSRIFYFKNSGNEEYYLSSADWMSRNLHKRVELMFKVNNKKLQRKLKNILDVYWSDNLNSWELSKNGDYIKREVKVGEKPVSAQKYFLDKIKVKSSYHVS
ncbi:MAG TPA: polyphosphate kinase 1 [Candidatus Kapabacteria bacterium]|nr:polyphosphate kinase 1 [Candidatus Kapabacteria bacterium]